MFEKDQLLQVPFSTEPRPFIRAVTVVSEWGICRDGHGFERPVKMSELVELNPVATIDAAMPPRLLLTLEVADDDDGYLFDGIEDDEPTDPAPEPTQPKPKFALHNRVVVKDIIDWNPRHGQAGVIVKIEDLMVAGEMRQLLTIDFGDGVATFFDVELDLNLSQPVSIVVKVERDALTVALDTIADQQTQIARLQQDALALREQNTELEKHKAALKLVRSALNDAHIEHSGYEFNQWERVNLLARRADDNFELAKKNVIRSKALDKQVEELQKEIERLTAIPQDKAS